MALEDSLDIEHTIDSQVGRVHAKRWATPDAASIALGFALAIAVCFPFFRGRLLLLDWVSGPNQPLVPPGSLGLAGGLTAGLPFDVVVNALDRAFGSVGSWLPVAAFFPIATFAIGRLIERATLFRLAAGLVYAVNPFVLDRIYAGQIAILLGYGLLPLAVRSVLRAIEERSIQSTVSLGLWAAALVALSPHFAWVLAVIALAAIAIVRVRGTALLHLAGGALIAAVISSYTLVVPLLGGSGPSAAGSQLAAYQTTSDPRVGLYVNVAGLYGFWRQGPVEPKNLLSGWPLVLAALVVVVVLGFTSGLRDPQRRRLAGLLALSGVIGYILALGARGPFGIYRWLYLHVPGFTIMREPEKFSMLLALAYAVGFGWGIEWLARAARRRAAGYAVAALAVALPALYTPNLVGGVGGQIAASSFPASWSTAAKAMSGPGSVLFLPWHEYQVQPFTDKRVVASPAQDYFARDVIQDDFAGVGYSFTAENASTRFVDTLVQRGWSVSKAGVFLAQLGVRWIVLDKTTDWQSYGWLVRQSDLRLVLNEGGIELFKNTSPITSAARVTNLDQVSSLDGMLSSDSVGSGHAYVVGGHASDPKTNSSFSPTSVRSRSTVALSVGPGRPGWLVTTIPFEAGWQLGKNAAVPLATGNLAVRIGSGASTLRFTRYTSTVLVELMSFIAFITCITYAAANWRRRRSGSRTP